MYLEIDDLNPFWGNIDTINDLWRIKVHTNIFVIPTWQGKSPLDVFLRSEEWKIVKDNPKLFTICIHGYDHSTPSEMTRSYEEQIEVLKRIQFAGFSLFGCIFKAPGNKLNGDTPRALREFGVRLLVRNEYPSLSEDRKHTIYNTTVLDLKTGNKRSVKSLLMHYGRDVNANVLNTYVGESYRDGIVDA